MNLIFKDNSKIFSEVKEDCAKTAKNKESIPTF